MNHSPHRLQYLARGSQVCVKRLKEALVGQVGEQLRTAENKKRIVALKLFTNITQLVRDLMHSPPQYKVTVSLSWRPSKVRGGMKYCGILTKCLLLHLFYVKILDEQLLQCNICYCIFLK